MTSPITVPITAMQAAVDIVNTSPHPVNKIAASLFGDGAVLAKTNFWPGPIAAHFGTGGQIGGSSGTVHAEVACLLAAPVATENASLCVTDPFCPNCAKAMAEAGIKNIYIDHKGFAKDFAARRTDQFQTLSMHICERAGINVFEVRRKDGIVTPILTTAPGYAPANDAPVIFSAQPRAGRAEFLDLIGDSRANLGNEKFAAALATDPKGNTFGLCAKACLAIGYSRRDDAPELHGDHGKYSFIHDPVNRLLMNAARTGLKIDGAYLYASTVPTSRELVNMTGAGLNRIHIGADADGQADANAALRQLRDAGILSVETL